MKYELLLLWLSLCLYVNCDLIVQTKYGKIRGLETTHSQAFLGVPYAAPPIGNLRWASPEPPSPWGDEIYNATEIKPGCTQVSCAEDNPSLVCPDRTAEDCLFLYIWAPLSTTPASKLPVMIYLHGGNFVHMSAGSLLFNGEYIAQRGRVIHVNVEYRLGALGFLYTGSNPGDARGNYGIQDQRRAMLWVQENIAAFGGDPEKVTLYGQSAGAQSTFVHLMSDKTAGLYRSVIIESSPFAIPFKTEVEALYLSGSIATLLNCKPGDMACLRSKTAVEIETAQSESRKSPTSLKVLDFFEPMGPFVDGDEVPMQPIEAAVKDKIRKIPTLIGTVTEETQIYVYEAFLKAMSPEIFIATMFATYPTKFLQIINKYPPFGLSDTRDLLQHVGTDFIFTCSTRNVTTNLLNHGESTIWRYEFDHYFSFPGWENFTCCYGHVCHGSEIVYLFHSAERGGFNFTADEEKLSDVLIGYWTNFAHTSDPNKGPTTVEPWPMLAADTQQVFHFHTPADDIWSHYKKSFCDFWDLIGYSA